MGNYERTTSKNLKNQANKMNHQNEAAPNEAAPKEMNHSDWMLCQKINIEIMWCDVYGSADMLKTLNQSDKLKAGLNELKSNFEKLLEEVKSGNGPVAAGQHFEFYQSEFKRLLYSIGIKP